MFSFGVSILASQREGLQIPCSGEGPIPPRSPRAPLRALHADDAERWQKAPSPNNSRSATRPQLTANGAAALSSIPTDTPGALRGRARRWDPTSAPYEIRAAQRCPTPQCRRPSQPRAGPAGSAPMCSALGLLTAAPGRHSTARGDASSGGCFAGPLPGHGDAQRCAVWAPWRPAALPFTTAQRCTESKSTAAPLRLSPAPPRIAASGTAPPARPKPPRLQKRRGKAQRFAALRVHPSADPRSPPPRTHHGAAGGAGSERAGPVSGAERGGGAGLRGGHACAHSDGAEGKKGGDLGGRGCGRDPPCDVGGVP